jgi:hypothetical protein
MPALGLDCYVLEARDASAVAPAVAALARDPRVESVQAMQAFETLSDAASDTARPTPADPLAAAQPARAAWQLDALHATTTGRGVTVAVIDSGIADAHPDLRGQIAAHRDFVDTDAARVVPERHGTAVAGLIAARAGNRIGIAGVAPDAKLLALRACWQRGGSQATSGDRAQCNTFTLAKALQFAIDRRAQVVNMSLGGPPDVLLSRLLAVAMQRGADRRGGGGSAIACGWIPCVRARCRRSVGRYARVALRGLPGACLGTADDHRRWRLGAGDGHLVRRGGSQRPGRAPAAGGPAPPVGAGARRSGSGTCARLHGDATPVDRCLRRRHACRVRMRLRLQARRFAGDAASLRARGAAWSQGSRTMERTSTK